MLRKRPRDCTNRGDHIILAELFIERSPREKARAHRFSSNKISPEGEKYVCTTRVRRGWQKGIKKGKRKWSANQRIGGRRKEREKWTKRKEKRIVAKI